ncbi:MAG: hypothetical protein ABSA70_16260 [Terriglobia bacterium]
MQEKLTLKERFQLIAFALLANVCLFGLLPFLDWLGVDVKKWFGFVLWTGFVFGVVVYACGHGMKRMRSLLVFGGLLTIHVAACVVYLRTRSQFPSLFFLFFAPLEAAIAASIMTTLGGVRPRLLRSRKYRPSGEFWTNRNDKGKPSRL